ncbi:serine/threonine protein phosphatase PrpC [Acetivibrio thermocellus AD2]|jgi:serine/threonine protein phosphatase PrpC|uniref:Serine/threonine protein phosphatase PrpC n=1 Tax=Acetivibrio thermocellus AD2 TaxID=1138384 RepID=A0AB36TGF3_ACETH|nr:protein phosphatase 2C domain-containing protein [Acetivibrio thermocellus]ADU74750.1 protein serine/threonine phosphatase [Acetivibrio thermocellus DSM 1313]ALX08701.1 protein serine/threonine phosphatase [Acetivibrio thermocellus AD2]ANV76453.1 protein serine/threonine phosphatase [Acetivibrio thermocellus DSM 2360]EIC05343.1 Protein phosphatase 2C-like protein [Acetivibrio thermocellus YS]NLU25963.1 serine/threonine-protein phosphatase [Acetivibrio thermocellus]
MLKRSFAIGALTDIGNVKKTNEDNILVKVGDEKNGEFGLFLVADGMGGLAAGEVASGIIVNEFNLWWERQLPGILNQEGNTVLDTDTVLNAISWELDRLIQDINKKIIRFGLSINAKVGSTLTLLFIYQNKYLIKHVGDSRIYRINSSITKLTEDHSWVAQQVKEGKIKEEEAKYHPKRNILTRCLGVMENLEIFEACGDISDDDGFLVCSDGFHNYLDEHEIYCSLSSCKKEDADVQKTLRELLEIVKLRGAADNISAVAVCQHIYRDYSDSILNIKGIINRITGNFGGW